MNGAREAQAMWFAAVLVLPVAFLTLFRVDELRIDAAERHNADLVASAARDQALLAQEPALERERAALDSALHVVALDAQPTRMVALFVRDAAKVAAAHRTVVTSIAAAAPPAAMPPFDSVGLDVSVEGRYADLLATLRDLTRMRVLATVEVTALGRKDAATNARLVASVHVLLSRLAPTVVPHARAGPA